MADDLNQLMKPAGASQPGDEPLIHVIPEKFYGAALKKFVPKPASAPGEGMPAMPADQTLMPNAAKSAKKTSKLPIILIAVLVLVLGGLAAYYFLVLSKPPVQPPINTNVAVNTNVPTGPVCGNARCETGESFSSCAADCPAPAPVCGDAQCAASESNATCPADCAPPAAVCGNGQCEEPTESTDSCPTDCKPPMPAAGADAESDGLTDLEETSIYGTSNSDPNTDKDSFVDLNEVLNLFDPSKPSPSNLRDAPGITVYANTEQKYEIFRPTAWSASTGDAESVRFSSADDDAVVVLISAKTGTLLEWYLEQSPGVSASSLVSYKTRQGYDALISPDQFTHYVDLGDRVAVLTYAVGQSNLLQYKVTFQMMVQSLKLLQ